MSGSAGIGRPQARHDQAGRARRVALGGAALPLGCGGFARPVGRRRCRGCERVVREAAPVLEDRPPEIARKRRAELGHVAVASRRAGQGLGNTRRRQLALALLGIRQAQAWRLEREPGHRRERRGRRPRDPDEEAAPEAHGRARSPA